MLIDLVKSESGYILSMTALGFLVLIPIALALFQELRIKKAETKLLLYGVLSHMMVCLTSLTSWTLSAIGQYAGNIVQWDVFALAFSEVGLFCFMRYEIFMLKKRAFISDWVSYFIAFLCGTNIIIMMIGMNQPNPWFFGYDSNGVLFATEHYILIYLLPVLVILFGAFLTWSCRETIPTSELFTFLSYFIFPLVGGIFDVFVGSSTVYPMGSLMLLMVYANVHTSAIRREVTNEKELTQSKAKLMVSQIQPHFMYNSLNSIYYLIDKDPERAQEAVSTFSDYLRQNVNSLRNDNPVYFSNEMAHTEAYLYLEKLRFEDLLEIETDIQAQDFLIPALTVQPLVENAVKHGVTQKENGGKVIIRSEEKDGDYIITISDNGVGFEAGEFKDDNAHSHVGIENVRSRLETMVDGKLYIKSVPGQGTVCTVLIPKEGQPNRD